MVRKLATMAEPLILWHQLRDMKNCKLRFLSNECCLDFKGQSIDEVSRFSLLRHCHWPSKGRIRQPAGRNFRPYDKLRYSSEPPFDALSKLCTLMIVAQPARELQPDFTSILSMLKLEKLTAPNFRINKDGETMSHSSRKRSPLAVFPLLLDV